MPENKQQELNRSNKVEINLLCDQKIEIMTALLNLFYNGQKNYIADSSLGCWWYDKHQHILNPLFVQLIIL